ncbi:MAG: 2-phosphosulfolactate phosphatase [Actinobacteria bacterium]|nr:2-phosphosulfolactate phosphatase [Actinomycetota bacterium]
MDVIRASSALVTMFQKGCGQVLLAGEIAEMHRLIGRDESSLCCAEDWLGRPVSGVQISPSLVELEQLDLTGKRVLFKTTNGTGAARFTWENGAPVVLVGSLRNATAAMGRALTEALRLGVGVAIVCAGREGNRSVALDDVYCAGVLVDRLLERACALGVSVDLKDSAFLARRVSRSYADPLVAFRESGSGKVMMEIGNERDIELCAQVDVAGCAPVLASGGPLWDILVLPEKTSWS